MFCPQCQAEYVDGITVCADCHIALVAELPKSLDDKSEDEAIEWAPLLSTTYLADIALIKSILESDKIDHWVDGENRAILRRGNMGSVIYVDSSRLEDAQNLIRDLDLNAFSWSTRTH